MKFWNLTARVKEDGTKVLDVTLYGDIDGGFFSDGVASAEIARQLAEHKDAKEIEQRINSRGGDVFGGLAIFNALQNHGAQVHSIVEGLAGSAASIAAMAGRTSMSPGSMMMIHNPWTVAVGDAAALRQTADTLDAVRDSLVSVYVAKTGKKAAELRAMLNAETWMSAEAAKKEGFAADIIGERLKARAEGETLILNAVSFPREGLPSAILAMAVPPPVAAPVVPAPPHKYAVLCVAMERIAAATGKPIGDLSQSDALTRELLNALPPITREEIAARSTGLLGEVLAEGHAAGVAAERARLKAIDELPVRGHAALVASAKYGAAPIEAPALAMAMLKAEGQAGANHLAARASESAPIAAIPVVSPEETDKNNGAKAEEAAAKQIAAHVNARRGGV